jgi:hypothetical protein
MRKMIPLLALLSLLTAVGCGGPDNRAEITGTVRLNGEPLATGSISFVPTDGTVGPSSGGEIINGKYHVPRTKGVAVGKNLVSIRSAVKTGRKVAGSFGQMEDEQVPVIPRKYNDQSELVRDIQPKSNQVDFELKGPPPRP